MEDGTPLRTTSRQALVTSGDVPALLIYADVRRELRRFQLSQSSKLKNEGEADLAKRSLRLQSLARLELHRFLAINQDEDPIIGNLRGLPIYVENY
jgi:hypothetical protein